MNFERKAAARLPNRHKNDELIASAPPKPPHAMVVWNQMSATQLRLVCARLAIDCPTGDITPVGAVELLRAAFGLHVCPPCNLPDFLATPPTGNKDVARRRAIRFRMIMADQTSTSFNSTSSILLSSSEQSVNVQVWGDNDRLLFQGLFRSDHSVGDVAGEIERMVDIHADQMLFQSKTTRALLSPMTILGSTCTAANCTIMTMLAPGHSHQPVCPKAKSKVSILFQNGRWQDLIVGRGVEGSYLARVRSRLIAVKGEGVALRSSEHWQARYCGRIDTLMGLFTNRSRTFNVEASTSREWLKGALVVFGLEREESEEYCQFCMPYLQANPFSVVTFAWMDELDGVIGPVQVDQPFVSLIRICLLIRRSESRLPSTSKPFAVGSIYVRSSTNSVVDLSAVYLNGDGCPIGI
uniref:Uncharacterized protein n=1 Tax=Spongospora subterranea TaxID=70186 RepID=A0A0H5RBI1_9EUKA|eukprot:CRZ11575.1 hypothetical protein [Spongospora subterranea]